MLRSPPRPTRCWATRSTMQDLIVTHLRTIWDTALADEWRRGVQPLQKMLAMSRQRSEAEVAAIAENLRALIVRDNYDEPGTEEVLVHPIAGTPAARRHQAAPGRDAAAVLRGPSSYPAVMELAA